MINSFIPSDFEVPTKLKHTMFRLEILEPGINDLDYEAVMSSKENLRSVFAEHDDWPADGMTLDENLQDLITHEKEFLAREAFAFTVLSPDNSICIGCLYIEPCNRDNTDAEIYFWIRDDKRALEPEFERTIKKWLNDDWPFDHVAYPGRDIPWKDWGKRSHDHLQSGAIHDT